MVDLGALVDQGKINYGPPPAPKGKYFSDPFNSANWTYSNGFPQRIDVVAEKVVGVVARAAVGGDFGGLEGNYTLEVFEDDGGYNSAVVYDNRGNLISNSRAEVVDLVSNISSTSVVLQQSFQNTKQSGEGVYYIHYQKQGYITPDRRWWVSTQHPQILTNNGWLVDPKGVILREKDATYILKIYSRR